MKSEVTPGFIEEVELKLIRRPQHPLRDSLGALDDLALSISKVGLLEPIVIRAIDNAFEVVAGNRRLAACRKLGMRKILCHIMTLDDKTAYEASLIENIHHHTLDPVEEAKAFRNYTGAYGYGGESELARRIGKSEQYVSIRIRMLSLPPEVITQVSRRLVTPSHAAELVGLDPAQQKTMSELVEKEHLSTREVRRLAKLRRQNALKNGRNVDWMEPVKDEDESASIRRERVLGKCLASLRSTMIRFDEVIVGLNADDWFLREMLIAERTRLHEQIDQIIRFEMMMERADRRLLSGKATLLR